MPKTYDEHKAVHREQLALADADPGPKPDCCPRDGEKITITRPKQGNGTATSQPDQDALDEWTCPNGHFGYLLPAEHLVKHPYDDQIQVCGMKRRTDPDAVSVVA
ncbi:hypothetical protein AB0E96_09535 [Kitasatospora sp. NPDC036755]|uniref:hypothetical protein n=1 Tax=Kitasatospora sp. NPDC036755 TaxID=3154600 RepID=UPI0033DC6BE8